MIYYKSAKAPTAPDMPIHRVRQLTLLSLLAYPAGAIMMVIGEAGTAGTVLDLTGLALILAAIIAAVPVMGSHVQRIIADDPRTLDEFEMGLRQRALGHAYAIFTGLALAAIFYCGLASDFGWWLPSGYDAFNALFWGVFLNAVLLPAALLSWGDDARALD